MDSNGTSYKKKTKNKILIFGGEFNNSGATAMTFVTVHEIEKRFPKFEAVMMMDPTESNIINNVTFRLYNDNKIVHDYILKMKSILFLKEYTGYIIKNIIKKNFGNIIHKKSLFFEFKAYKKELEEAVAVFDISGFQLSSYWSIDAYNTFTNKIKMCNKYDIPMYIMPQSIGPLEFSDKRIEELTELLSSVRIIFAREKEGYNYLTEQLGLNNVVESTDLVLQNNFVEFEKLLHKREYIDTTDMFNKNNSVAIIPNERIFDRYDNDMMLELYKSIIDELLNCNKIIYILRHSKEDIYSAQLIKEQYKNHKQVIIVEEQFTSYQFEDIIKKFDYVIASRYHAIVHAYKNNIPCIAIGWAVKYKELLEKFSQSQYMFDARNQLLNEELTQAVRYMNDNYMEEKKIIGSVLKTVRERNCFDLMEEDLENILKTRCDEVK